MLPERGEVGVDVGIGDLGEAGEKPEGLATAVDHLGADASGKSWPDRLRTAMRNSRSRLSSSAASFRASRSARSVTLRAVGESSASRPAVARAASLSWSL
jgi:hypothetical protein